MLLHEPCDVTVDPAFRTDVLAGLRTEQRAIPARWFYDRAGSELFEAITALPEYYPTTLKPLFWPHIAMTSPRLPAQAAPSSNLDRAPRSKHRT